eukprot:TRINITY_DN979_c0_g2_i5.p1 TRINITY_DN979_c0_g2~~TRINITY_DN979_c0_g2_i5.p1  ORF type:complete len:513 (+),score=149.67 TRINITY_DN979_c0_g2_i5:201-1541(+)
MNWPTIKLGKFVADNQSFKFESNLSLDVPNATIPVEVYEHMMNNNNLILAGGAVVDFLLGRSPKDYDLFCIETRPIFRTENWIETSFSISSLSRPKIQLIKRIYDNPEQVIGGFDLDSSRFYMNSNLEVFSTYGGLASLVFKINPINFSCYSATFPRRIAKYKRKGFVPVYVNKVYQSGDEEETGGYPRHFNLNNRLFVFFKDYDFKLSSNNNMSFTEKTKLLNFCCLLRGEFDGFSITNGNVIKKEEFIEMAEQHKLKELKKITGIELYSAKDYFVKTNRFFPKTEFARGYMDLSLNNYSHEIPTNMLCEFLHKLRLENIEKNYPHYLSIVDKFRITNPGSQHTSSFHPIQFKTLEEHSSFKKKIFGKDYLPHDLSSPDIMGWLMCSKTLKFLPKPIIVIITSYLCAIKLMNLTFSHLLLNRNETIMTEDNNSRKRKQNFDQSFN